MLLILNQHLEAPGSSVKEYLWITFNISSLISFDSLYQLLNWYDGWKEGSLSERHGEPTIRPGCERKKRREASFRKNIEEEEKTFAEISAPTFEAFTPLRPSYLFRSSPC